MRCQHAGGAVGRPRGRRRAGANTWSLTCLIPLGCVILLNAAWVRLPDGGGGTTPSISDGAGRGQSESACRTACLSHGAGHGTSRPDAVPADTPGPDTASDALTPPCSLVPRARLHCETLHCRALTQPDKADPQTPAGTPGTLGRVFHAWGIGAPHRPGVCEACCAACTACALKYSFIACQRHRGALWRRCLVAVPVARTGARQ